LPASDIATSASGSARRCRPACAPTPWWRRRRGRRRSPPSLDLDLQVGGGEGDVLAVLAHQDVGEDRQRLPTFDDAADHLQRPEQRIAAGLTSCIVFLFSQNKKS